MAEATDKSETVQLDSPNFIEPPAVVKEKSGSLSRGGISRREFLRGVVTAAIAGIPLETLARLEETGKDQEFYVGNFDSVDVWVNPKKFEKGDLPVIKSAFEKAWAFLYQEVISPMMSKKPKLYTYNERGIVIECNPDDDSVRGYYSCSRYFYDRRGRIWVHRIAYLRKHFIDTGQCPNATPEGLLADDLAHEVWHAYGLPDGRPAGLFMLKTAEYFHTHSQVPRRQ